MNYQVREIADRLKALREIAGLTPAQMAEKTGVTEETYLKLEQGETDFSFSFIYKCAEIFGVDIRDLLEGSSPNLSIYTVTRKGRGMRIPRNPGFVYDNLAPQFKGKVVEPFYVVIPGDAKESYSTHHGQEIDVVLEGRLSIDINGNREVLEPGDTVYYNSSYPHALRALDGKECRIYAFVIKTAYEEIQDVRDEYVTRPLSREESTVAHDFILTKTAADGYRLQERGTVQLRLRLRGQNRGADAGQAGHALGGRGPEDGAPLHLRGHEEIQQHDGQLLRVPGHPERGPGDADSEAALPVLVLHAGAA